MNAICRKRPHLLENGILHHDTTPSHSLQIVKETMQKIGLPTISLSPYSPVTAHADFALFPKLTERLEGMKFETREDLVKKVTKELQRIGQNGFHDMFMNWVLRHRKCIQHQGKYFEKK